MSTTPSLRLHLFHARDTTRTVILRQGPTKTCRMILWDRDGDKFQDGQWLKQKVYVERCDLSPDGEHFIYFTLDVVSGPRRPKAATRSSASRHTLQPRGFIPRATPGAVAGISSTRSDSTSRRPGP